MPQQQPDSFVPDSFVPDSADSFVPDSFVPDKPATARTPEQLREASFKAHINTPMFGLSDEFYESVRQNISNKIAMSDWIPETLKPGLAGLSQVGAEIPRLALETIGDPASVLYAPLIRGGQGIEAIMNIFKKPPEVAPPAPKSPAGLLTSGDPYIAGPGGIQRRSLLTPHEEARLAGFEPDNLGTPAQPTGTALEIPRPSPAPHYTSHEAGGGTSLQVGNTTDINGVRFTVDENGNIVPAGQPIPATAGETGLGFEPVSRAGQPAGPLTRVGDATLMSGEPARMHPSGTEPLPYPLNVVPESVRPRQAQTVERALVGQDVKPELPLSQTPKEPSTLRSGTRKPTNIEAVLEDIRDLKGGTAALVPGEPILKAPIKETIRDIRRRVVAEANKNGGMNLPDNAVDVVPPEIQEPLAKTIANTATMPRPIQRLYETLKELSPTLFQKSARAVHLERQYAERWIPLLKDALSPKKLTKTELANFGGYVEGTLKSPSPNVERAVQVWKLVEDQIGDEAIRTNLPMFANDTQRIAFQKNPNYWPRWLKEQIPHKDMIQRLVRNGMSVHEAQRVLRHWRRTGEFKLGAQFARDPKAQLPYRLDADVALAHARSMSRRLAQNIEFGPKDISGRGAEGVADLIDATANPKLANQLMERILAREDIADQKLNRLLDIARGYSTITKLKNYTIPNLVLGNLNTAQYASRHPYEALKEVSKLLSKRYRTDLAKSGIWTNYAHTLAEEMGNLKKDVHLIGMGEVFNRGIAGAAGKSVARQAFADLKKNPLDKQAIKELSELILEPIEDLMKQDALTNNQLDLAAARTAELTQGLNVPGNLPYWASTPVTGYPSLAVQLSLIFKKMAFQSTAMIKDTLDPTKVGAMGAARNLATWMALTQVAGEATGDVKSIFAGLWRGGLDKGDPLQGVADKFGDRGDYWLQGNGISPAMINGIASATGSDPQLIARLIDNWTQAYMAGMPFDMLQAADRPGGLTAWIAGPVMGDVDKITSFLVNQDYRGLLREATRNIPLPGVSEIPQTDAFKEAVGP